MTETSRVDLSTGELLEDAYEDAFSAEDTQPNPHHIPDFEGQKVNFTKAKLTSVAAMEIDDEVLKLDDIVRMMVEGRVVRIDHVIDERSGHLVRVHTIKVIDGEIIPWEREG